MRNLRKILATSALFLALSLTAYGRDGWMSTGSKPTPTPPPLAPAATTTGSEAAAAAPAPDDEGSGLLDSALQVSLSILRNALTLL